MLKMGPDLEKEAIKHTLKREKTPLSAQFQ
jgi:hypothetical protein